MKNLSNNKRAGHIFHNVIRDIGPDPLHQALDGLTCQDFVCTVKAEREVGRYINLRFQSEGFLCGLESAEFCLVFEPYRDGLFDILRQPSGGAEINPPEIMPDGMDIVVFVPIGKRAENGQMVWIGKVPYLVRLAIFNETDGGGRHSLDHRFPLIKRLLSCFGVLGEDRKCGLGGRGTPIADDKLAGQMVQGGSQIMRDISNNDPDILRGLLRFAYTNYLVSFLNIWIDEKRIGIRVKEGLDKSVKLVSVMMRPAYFQADSTEVKHGMMSLEMVDQAKV